MRSNPIEETRKLRESLDDVWDVMCHVVRIDEAEPMKRKLEFAIAVLEALEERFDPEAEDDEG